MYLTDRGYEYSNCWNEVIIEIKGTSDQIYLTQSDLEEMLQCLKGKDNEDIEV